MPVVEIERLDHQGRGIGKIDGKIVFVPKTLPSEVVNAKLVLEKNTFYEGEIIEIIRTSDDRKKVICPHFFECGGCQFLHMDYQKSLNFKQNKVKEIINKYVSTNVMINPIVPSDESLFYRNKITLQVNKMIGYYKEKTNFIIPIEMCYIADSQINKIYNQLKDNINMDNIDQIIIRSSKKTMESMVIFKTKNSIDKNQIINLLKEDTDSIYMNNDLVYGKDKIIEKLFDYQFYISPTSFFQVNTNQAEKLYEIAITYADISSEDVVLDLYCGTGTIGIVASKYAKKVVGIELNKSAIDDANLNKNLNNIPNIEFYAGDVGKILSRKNYHPNVVIVDPPRSGLDSLAIKEIINIKPRKMVYVSCDLMTLARDLNMLSQYFEIKELTPVDLFPQTSHVESVVKLELKDSL